MDRLIYKKLLDWKSSPERKPLIVRGVRQCGKTYILRKFGEENYSNVAYFNFEETKDLEMIFKPDLDPNRILDDLRLRYHSEISSDTLLIFDEIQICGAALTAMKYFYEKAPQYHVICVGSLLGVMLSKPTSFPVGKVTFMTMYPMSFPEFLAATGEHDLFEKLNTMTVNESISEVFMTVLMRTYKEYCFVGGMPEAVKSWISRRDPQTIRDIQSQILMAYWSDFAKYAPPKDVQKLNNVWTSIPTQLSKENKKFLFGHAVKGARAKDLEDALQWLIDAGLVIKVNMISRPFLPLSAYAEMTSFKLYYADVGLLGAMAKLPASALLSSDDRYKEFKGGMTENYVLTELITSTEAVPFYWRSGNRAEVDFVHLIRDIIVPIEVKSGFPGRIQSMERYMDEYDPDQAFVVSEHNLRVGKLTHIPLPMVWKLKDYVD